MEARHKLAGGDFTATRHSMSYDYISPLKLDLSDKHVLITGAAWEDGVGYATATAFARAGASTIAVADVYGVLDKLATRLKEVATSAGRAEPIVAFDGWLDVVVNNVAHMEPYVPLLETDLDVYWRTYEVNVRGLFNMTRVFLPMQLSTPSGLCTMIKVASSGALSARPGSGSYRSSKLAILRWTETLQLEYAGKGLLAFCVNPGAIKTKITETAPEEVRNRFPDRPEVAGDTIAWLAAERREWLAGRYVGCTWDMQELLGRKDEIVEEDKLKMRMAF